MIDRASGAGSGQKVTGGRTLELAQSAEEPVRVPDHVATHLHPLYERLEDVRLGTPAYLQNRKTGSVPFTLLFGAR